MYTLLVATNDKITEIKSSIRPSIEQFSDSLVKIVTSDNDGFLDVSYLNVDIVRQISVKDGER